jgi:hypothetical protein
MGTTANNNWPTPVASDLVKDGWEAIQTLATLLIPHLAYTPPQPLA